MKLNWAARQLPPISQRTLAKLARASLQRDPSPEATHRLGALLIGIGEYEEAIAIFESAAAMPANHAGHRKDLARAYLHTGNPEKALTLLRDRDGIWTAAGRGVGCFAAIALLKLDRYSEAKEILIKEIDTSNHGYEPLEVLLRSVLVKEGPEAFDDLCARHVPPAYHNSPVYKGYSALSASMKGDTAAAAQLIDFDLVWRTSIAVPEPYGTMEEFNRALQQEICVNPDLYGFRTEPAKMSSNILGYHNEPELRMLLQSFQSLCESYLKFVEQRGGAARLPAIPDKVDLGLTATILNCGGYHNAHLHRFGLISGTYYVTVPYDPADDGSAGGCLSLGSAVGLIPGHSPCWPTLDIKPEPGMAVMFPSHLFHGVAPSRSEQPRVAVAFDMVAAGY